MDLKAVRETLSVLRTYGTSDPRLIECVDALAEILEEHQRVLRNHAREIQRKSDDILGMLGGVLK